MIAYTIENVFKKVSREKTKVIVKLLLKQYKNLGELLKIYTLSAVWSSLIGWIGGAFVSY